MKSNLDNEIEILKSRIGGKYGKKVKPEHINLISAGKYQIRNLR
jgi:hypothetical protein